jgi:hypothetical protein
VASATSIATSTRCRARRRDLFCAGLPSRPQLKGGQIRPGKILDLERRAQQLGHARRNCRLAIRRIECNCGRNSRLPGMSFCWLGIALAFSMLRGILACPLCAPRVLSGVSSRWQFLQRNGAELGGSAPIFYGADVHAIARRHRPLSGRAAILSSFFYRARIHEVFLMGWVTAPAWTADELGRAHTSRAPTIHSCALSARSYSLMTQRTTDGERRTT